MDIRYIYMHRDNAKFHPTEWMDAAESDSVASRALLHASKVVRCPVLVVERDPSTGFMVPLGVAAAR